ncbi:hypothetical protein FB45DRAFT_899088 [Roridomyces roridus]|uniref:Uncharacterized protein n=1 Tax=Roridomyces roridus TaxID=1738132 RepID=A0AAD7CD68_9AGAR|nr:hypothetical protein FB45DRAFT_899088 [Roridomyces roridus]
MLALGLKLAFFALSLLGLIGCWAVLLPLAWATKSYWAPLVYAVAILELNGVFCLGMIWRMDPTVTPRAFCIAEVLVTGCGTFVIIGLLAAITTWTFVYVSKPKEWAEVPVLPWRFHYLLPMLLFPLLASAVNITVVVFFYSNTTEPFEGLNCVVRPPWIQFVGFAGTPFIVTIPCLWLTALSIIRLRRTLQHIRRARHSLDQEHTPSQASPKSGLTPPTPRAITVPSPSASTLARMSRSERQQPNISGSLSLRHERAITLDTPSPVTSGSTSTSSGSGRYFTASSHVSSYPSTRSSRSRRSDRSFDTVSSVVFAPRRAPRTLDTLSEGVGLTQTVPVPPMPTLPPIASNSNSNISRGTTRSSSLAFSIQNHDRISVNQITLDENRDGPYETLSTLTDKSPATRPSRGANLPELPSLVIRLLVFQIAIIATHFLSFITPFVDAISFTRSGGTAAPASVGTQHVALVLAGWVPVFVFATYIRTCRKASVVT